ncbi:hypothetical protein D3C81_2320150 [compost metagenome]
MAENNAGARFDLKIAQTLFLCTGKIKHLLLGEFDIVNILAAEFFHAAINFGVRQAIIPTVVVIEFYR